MEDLVLSIPIQDAAFIETLAQRMGWTMRKRRTSVERFINSCPKSSQMTDEEIQAEINAVRYRGTANWYQIWGNDVYAWPLF